MQSRIGFAFVVLALASDAAVAETRSAACHVDVACGAGDGYADQRRAIARLTVGNRVCTGQLIANTAGDLRPLVLTAAHCIDTAEEAQSVVVHWRYASPSCRAVGSADNATPLPLTGAIEQRGGARLVMVHAATDTALIELNQPPPAAAEPYFVGWDRRTLPRREVAMLHHAGGDELRISLERDALGGGRIGDKPAGTSISGPELTVSNWDLGSAQAGSDGGGLYTAEGLVIGQLARGSAACGNSSESVFGRLGDAWAGGGTRATRLSDHLDPLESGAEIFAGQSGGCAAPSVALSLGTDDFPVGASIPIEASIEGGTPPYRVEWDIEGDGFVDRRVENAGARASIRASYAESVSVTAFARVTDARSCTTTEAIQVDTYSPNIEFTPAAPVQVCGDGDAAIEPGERWEVPVELRNTGGQALDDPHAVFIASFAGGDTIAGPDGYGNTLADDGTGCVHAFIDLEPTEPALSLVAAGESTVADEGRTAPIAVTPFDFYGERVTQLVMSTNGYLSSDPAESGNDYSNQCAPAPPDRGSVGARINVFWDDLALRDNGALRHRRFDDCPRPAETTRDAVACHVFQWSHVGLFTGEGAPDGDFDFQVVIYPATNEIALQYRRDPPNLGADAGVSFRNRAATDALEYACFAEGAVVDQRSVCLFHPAFPSSAAAGAAIRLETPAVALPDLAPGASTQPRVRFAVDPVAACGAFFEVKYRATLDGTSFSQRNDPIVEGLIGNDQPCDVATNCPAQPPAIVPRDGLYSSFTRFGNGVGSFNIPIGGGRTLFGGQWFTGNADRTPTWLILSGEIADAQARLAIFRFRQRVDQPAFAVEREVAGTATVTYTSPTEYVLTFELDGREGAERLALLYGTNRPSPNRTGSWFPPSEAGWGQAIDDHILPNGQSEQVIVNYFYDGDGNPVWTLGGGALAGGTMSHNAFFVHCPACALLPDFVGDAVAAGTTTTTYEGNARARYTTAITFPERFPGAWRRSEIVIQRISP